MFLLSSYFEFSIQTQFASVIGGSCVVGFSRVPFVCSLVVGISVLSTCVTVASGFFSTESSSVIVIGLLLSFAKDGFSTLSSSVIVIGLSLSFAKNVFKVVCLCFFTE